MNKSKWRSLGLFLLCIFSGQVLSGQYVATSSGDFDDPTIWQGGVVPPNPLNDDLTINSGVSVTMTSSITTVQATGQGLTFTINGELNDGGNAYSLTIEKKWDLDIDGTLNIGTLNLLQYNGANKPIGDFTANANITLSVLNSGGTINNAGSLTVTEATNLTAGELNNTGSFQAENMTNDGTITNNGSGTITVSGTLTNNGTVTNNAPQENFVVSVLVNNGTITGNGIVVTTLPLKLIYFAAKLYDGKVEIDFEVEDVFGVDSYQIDHSTDGEHFETILDSKVLPSTDFSNEIKLTHFYPQKSTNYYALYAVDQDGERSFLRMTTVDLFDKLSGSPLIYSHKGVLKLQFQEEGEHDIRVFNLEGRLLHRESNFEQASNIDLSSLNSGLYVVRVENGSRPIVKKMYLNR